MDRDSALSACTYGADVPDDEADVHLVAMMACKGAVVDYPKPANRVLEPNEVDVIVASDRSTDDELDSAGE